MEKLSDEERRAIRLLASSRQNGKLYAMKEIRGILGVSIHDAASVYEQLIGSER
jgi:ribosomal protein L7/L12